MLVRIGFGLSLALMGVAFYETPGFAESIGRGLGMFESLGMVWGYILPFLFIVGGVLICLGIFMTVATWLAGLALLSIPVGLLLKSVLGGISPGDTLPTATGIWIWVLVFLVAVRGGGHHGIWGVHGCNCGNDGCKCDCHAADANMKAMKPPVQSVKVVPTKVSASKKTATKSGKKN